MDFILNGQVHGGVAATLMQNNMDLGALRPWIHSDGRSFVTLQQNGQPVAVPLLNANATLRKDDWLQIDEAIIKAAKPRLKGIADLRAAGLTYTIPNGMGKTVLQTETQSDINGAEISMDGLRESQHDRPLFNLTNLPLPIIHKDFHFSMRQVMASRNGGSPLDTTTAELAGRRVAEEAEKLLLGVAPSYSYGGGTVYGYINMPSINTRDLTSPTETGWTPQLMIAEILAMKAQSQADFQYGPWVLYTSIAWETALDTDFSPLKGDNTLRQRIKQIEGITDIRTLDYLGTGYKLLLVQMTPDNIRLVIGMEMTTVQWESKGGMQLNFKVMTIMVPQIRVDFNGSSGIVYGAAGLPTTP